MGCGVKGDALFECKNDTICFCLQNIYIVGCGVEGGMLCLSAEMIPVAYASRIYIYTYIWLFFIT